MTTASGTAAPDAAAGGTRMRFSADGWDAGYGNALDVDAEVLVNSAARVDTDVEVPTGQCAPIPASGAGRCEGDRCSAVDLVDAS